MNLGNIFVGKRLFVGCGKPEALGKGKSEVRGSAYVEGPLQVGRDSEYNRIEATVMIAEEFNPDSEQYVTQTVLVGPVCVLCSLHLPTPTFYITTLLDFYN